MKTEPLSDWAHAIAEIPDGGLARDRKLPADATAAVAETLGLLTLSHLSTSYRIERLPGGAYRLRGRVHAAVEQPCVVTLDPVADQLDEPFDVEFWPDLQKDAGSDEDKTVLDARDVEQLTGQTIPVGRIVYETVAAALDPYPRKAGAAFSWAEKAPETSENVSPFAALSKLKKAP